MKFQRVQRTFPASLSLSQLISFYSSLEDWQLYKECLSLEEFSDFAVLWDPKKVGYQCQLSRWRELESIDYVLLLYFQHMIVFAKALDKLADFLDFDLDDQLREVVATQFPKLFMSKHMQQFEDYHIKRRLDELGRRLCSRDTPKINSGTNQENKYSISGHLKGRLDKAF